MQRNETGPLSYIIYKNSKWIKDLDVRPEIIKSLEENTDNKLFDMNLSNIFLETIFTNDISEKQLIFRM